MGNIVEKKRATPSREKKTAVEETAMTNWSVPKKRLRKGWGESRTKRRREKQPLVEGRGGL